MKSHLVRVSMLVLGAAAAWAQNPYPLRADVPFDFNVSGRTLPAGHYRVTAAPFSGFITLQAESGGERVTVQTISAESVTAPLAARLVFHRYGDQYFLAETWTPESNIGRHIPASKQERQLAQVHRTPGQAVVAAK